MGRMLGLYVWYFGIARKGVNPIYAECAKWVVYNFRGKLNIVDFVMDISVRFSIHTKTHIIIAVEFFSLLENTNIHVGLRIAPDSTGEHTALPDHVPGFNG